MASTATASAPEKSKVLLAEAVKSFESENPEGLRKAAIFILSLDEETASLVLKNMSDKEAEQITREIARLGMVEKKQIQEVLGEFTELSKVQRFIREGGSEQAQRLIKKAFPESTAKRLIQLLEAQKDTQKQHIPFGFLKSIETDSLYTFLLDEHPQTVALVLSYAEAAKAAEVLAKFPPERQFDIVKRIANLEHTSPEAIKHVESGLKKFLTSLAFEEYQEIGGVRTVAEILNVMDRSKEKAILESLQNDNPELVETIKKLMFVFEDIIRVDDKGVQNVLKEVENKQLSLALKTASPELKAKIFKNMSQRASAMVQEEMDFLGAVRVTDVEIAQQGIVDIVRRLEETGDVIIMGRGGEGELVA